MNWKENKDNVRIVKVSLFSRISIIKVASALFLLAFMVLVTMPLTEASSLRPYLVGEWRFDEGYGLTAYDASGEATQELLAVTHNTAQTHLTAPWAIAWSLMEVIMLT